MPVHLPTAEQKKHLDDQWLNAPMCLLCNRRNSICGYLKRHDSYYKKKYPAKVYEQQACVPHLSLEEVYHRLYREEAKQVIILYTSAPHFKEITFSFANNQNYHIIYKD